MKHSICIALMCGLLALCCAGCGMGNNGDNSFVREPDAMSTPDTASSVAAAPVAPSVKLQNAVSDVTAHTANAIRQNGTLTVAVVENNPPFTFFNDDLTRQGYDNAIANTIAEELGVEVSLFSGTPEEVVDAVRTGRVDVGLGGFSSGDKLLKGTLETSCYAGGKQVLLCCIEDVKLYPTLASFNKKDIACLSGMNAQKDILKELLPDSAPMTVRNIAAGLRKLRSGETIALMLDEFQGLAYGEDCTDLGLATPKLETEILVDPKCILVMEGNENLAQFINDSVIAKYTKTGGLGRLMISATTKADNLGLLDG